MGRLRVGADEPRAKREHVEQEQRDACNGAMCVGAVHVVVAGVTLVGMSARERARGIVGVGAEVQVERLLFRCCLCVCQDWLEWMLSDGVSLSPRHNQACCPMGGGVHALIMLTIRVWSCVVISCRSLSRTSFFRAPGMYFSVW